MPVTLYNSVVYPSAIRQASGFSSQMNVAPWGPNGVDEKLQRSLNVYDEGSSGRKDSLLCKDIVLTWIIGACNQRAECTDTSLFPDYYENVLRFQAAVFRAEMTPFSVHHNIAANLGMAKHPEFKVERLPERFVRINEIEEVIKDSGPRSFGAYIHFNPNKHTIGIYIEDRKTFYILDSYAGLFVYESEIDFYADLNSAISIMRVHFRLSIIGCLTYQPFSTSQSNVAQSPESVATPGRSYGFVDIAKLD